MNSIQPQNLADLLDSSAPAVDKSDWITNSQKLRELSYSSLLTLHACPRKYELSKLARDKASDSRSVTFAFGHAVGAGIQSYLLDQDLDKAILAAFLAYDYDLLDEGWASEQRAKKSFATAVLAIQKFEQVYKLSDLHQYEVAVINDQPAIELSFSIQLLDGFIYRGYVDAVLRHRYSGELLVLELKTTSGTAVNEASYKNSAQALGYSIVLDSLASEQQSFDVRYLVYKTNQQEYEPMNFTKFFDQKVNWIRTVINDCELISKYESNQFFPSYGESCYNYFRPCEFYGTCTLSSSALYPADKLHKPDTAEYNLQLDLVSIITAMEQANG